MCNLASLSLPSYVINGEFNHQKLYEVTKVVTKNLNKVIDGNFYPVPEAKTSNFRHRPIAIGVQGFADALMMLRLPFESDEARALNREIFETIYFGSMTASMELAKEQGPMRHMKGLLCQKGNSIRFMGGAARSSLELG